MKYVLNIVDNAGAIRTGYEQILEGDREGCVADYEYWLRASGVEFVGVDVQEVVE